MHPASTTLVVGSAFRNAAGKQVERWASQVSSLRSAARERDITVRCVAVEGDSTDDTRGDLISQSRRKQLYMDLRTHDHGGPVFGSVEHADRMSALSGVCNAILDGVDELDDYLLYVESDLIWSPGTVLSLLSYLQTGACRIVAPLVFAGPNFYDVYAYRGLDGSRFAPFAPYHSSLNPEGLTEVSSVGSCLLMTGEVARKVRIMDGGALVGWCKQARLQGYKVYVSTSDRVEHPA